MVWVFLPIFAGMQWMVPMLRPTCESGYSNYSLLIVALVVGHHLAAESRSWAAARGLISRPEKTIMHQLGVIGRRRRLLVLGLLEDLDIYTDLMFPFIAYSCDAKITERWLQSWSEVPTIGHPLVRIFRHLRFWGFSGLGVAAACMGGIFGLSRLMLYRNDYRQRGIEGMHSEIGVECTPRSPTRLTGEEFFSLARFSDIALMPSLADLCQEMAEQRRWIFASKEEEGGALNRTRAQTDAIFGKVTAHDLQLAELRDEAARERVDRAQQVYFVILLLGRTLVGNALQLWLQSSFFELGYENLGREAHVKLVIGMAISVLHLCVRCFDAFSKLGCFSLPFVVINVAVMAWSMAKIGYAFTCPQHVWNLSTGCVDIAHSVPIV